MDGQGLDAFSLGNWRRWMDEDLREAILKFVEYSSVSLSPTLDKNEKVEQYIRKKTYKPTILRFWVEGGVIPLCGLTHLSFL